MPLRLDPKPASGDTYVLGLIAKSRHLLVPHFLIHSYLYYVLDAPVVSDSTFDLIVSRLAAEWDDIEHPHKSLIDRSLLKSGFYLAYPPIVIGSALQLKADLERNTPGKGRKPGKRARPKAL